jgi:hypothetical protein
VIRGGIQGQTKKNLKLNYKRKGSGGLIKGLVRRTTGLFLHHPRNSLHGRAKSIALQRRSFKNGKKMVIAAGKTRSAFERYPGWSIQGGIQVAQGGIQVTTEQLILSNQKEILENQADLLKIQEQLRQSYEEMKLTLKEIQRAQDRLVASQECVRVLMEIKNRRFFAA